MGSARDISNARTVDIYQHHGSVMEIMIARITAMKIIVVMLSVLNTDAIVTRKETTLAGMESDAIMIGVS